MSIAKTPEPRMGRRLVEPYPAPKPTDAPTDPKKVVKSVKALEKKKPKPLIITGRVITDDQFHGVLTFSPAYGDDAGRTYGASLSLTPGADSPEGNQPFYIRITITQTSGVDPTQQLQAFKCEWEPPPGWVPIDDVDTDPFTYDEAISNPLVVGRVYRSPASPSTAIGFRVRIRAKYLP